ncbi:MAG: phosphodiester glycosidase family protein [Longimicrobiales bacterium]
MKKRALLVLVLAACATGRQGSSTSLAAPAALADADTLRTDILAPGVTLHFAWDSNGPWAMHIVEIDRLACRAQVNAVKAGPPLSARATTSSLHRGIATINADFFAIPAGTTAGAHVRHDSVLIGPSERPVFAVSANGFTAGLVHLDAFAAVGRDTLRLIQVNRPVSGGDATLFTHWFGDSIADSVATILTLRRTGSARGIVTARLAAGQSAPLDEFTVALAGTDPWFRRRAPGDTVAWNAILRTNEGDAVHEAVGGFPVLLRDGADVLARQPGVRPAFAEQRHPRTALGWSDDRWFWVVVDGRQHPYSDGMTLPELAHLFQRLGATNAMNLDGGGSSTLVAKGQVMNRPSDQQGERPVGNALSLIGCAPWSDLPETPSRLEPQPRLFVSPAGSQL